MISYVCVSVSYTHLIVALPLAACSIMQQLFNSVGVAVVGRFAGSEALAAVGSNGAVINLLVTLFSGISLGSNEMCIRDRSCDYKWYGYFRNDL